MVAVLGWLGGNQPILLDISVTNVAAMSNFKPGNDVCELDHLWALPSHIDQAVPEVSKLLMKLNKIRHMAIKKSELTPPLAILR